MQKRYTNLCTLIVLLLTLYHVYIDDIVFRDNK